MLSVSQEASGPQSPSDSSGSSSESKGSSGSKHQPGFLSFFLDGGPKSEEMQKALDTRKMEDNKVRRRNQTSMKVRERFTSQEEAIPKPIRNR